MNPKVDQFLIDGCGRCSYYKTPDCKVINWTSELQALREIVLDSILIEEYKWSQPCYTYNNNNVLMVSSFKDCAFISFFKGALLEDPDNLLVSPGKNSQAARLFKFTNVDDIIKSEFLIKAYIHEAIENEKQGLKIEFKQDLEPMPEELIQKMESDEAFKLAFQALTKGRQRGYIIHFSQPKQSKTRASRIEKCTAKIMSGEGMHDHYKRTNNKS